MARLLVLIPAFLLCGLIQPADTQTTSNSEFVIDTPADVIACQTSTVLWSGPVTGIAVSTGKLSNTFQASSHFTDEDNSQNILSDFLSADMVIYDQFSNLTGNSYPWLVGPILGQVVLYITDSSQRFTQSNRFNVSDDDHSCFPISLTSSIPPSPTSTISDSTSFFSSSSSSTITCPASTSSPTSRTSHSSNIAAIAGGVSGCISVILLLAFLGYKFHVRRRRLRIEMTPRTFQATSNTDMVQEGSLVTGDTGVPGDSIRSQNITPTSLIPVRKEQMYQNMQGYVRESILTPSNSNTIYSTVDVSHNNSGVEYSPDPPAYNSHFRQGKIGEG
ncbi:hypothetical protein BDQ17DRAFT_1433544 [Cyathus striatus]|nr:hypothetical protein BDQ17DRAFT_1433544 [Cyathus striatus]